MTINYKITDFNPKDGVFIILYYDGEIDNGVEYNIPLPFNRTKTAYLSGGELHRYIMSYAPVGEFIDKRLVEKLNTSHIDSLVYDKTENWTKLRKDQILKEEYEANFDRLYSTVAQSKDYTTWDSLMSYANSKDPVYRREAQAAIDWRDECTKIFYKHWNAYVDNGIPMPEWEDFMKLLPEIVW